MKIKIILTVITASATLMFSACEASNSTTGNANNKSNTSIGINSNSAQAAVNKAVTAANTAANTVANTAANMVSAADKAIQPAKNDGKITGDYLVGDVKCTITPDEKDRELYSQVKCADNRKVETYSREDDPSKKRAMLVSGKNQFVFENHPAADGTYNTANGTFTDDKGKTVKVTRAQ